MLKAKSSENFLSPNQNAPNFCGVWVLGVMGLKSFDFYSFTPKGTSLRRFTLFKPFCVKIG